MDVARDLLDKLVVDRAGREIGRVDRVALDVPDDGPPRLVGIEVGAAALATRLHPRLGRLIARLERALGLERPRPLAAPMTALHADARHIRVDVAFDDTPAAEVEARLRRWLPPWREGRP